MPKSTMNDAEYGRWSRIMDWHAGLRWRDKQTDTHEGRDFLIKELKRLPKSYKKVKKHLVAYLQNKYNVNININGLLIN